MENMEDMVVRCILKNTTVEREDGHRFNLTVKDKVWWVDTKDDTMSGEYIVTGITSVYRKLPGIDGSIILTLEGIGGINEEEVVHAFSTRVYMSQPADLIPVVDVPVGIIGYARAEAGAIAVGSIYGGGDKNYTVKRIKNYGLQNAWLLTETPPEDTPSVMRFVISVTADYAASSGDSAEYDITDALKTAMYKAIDGGLLDCEYQNIGLELTVTRSEDV